MVQVLTLAISPSLQSSLVAVLWLQGAFSAVLQGRTMITVVI
jgi:hypothetical protein